MSILSRELVILILQFCNEEGFNETAHVLERESGFYFDMKYFEDMVLCGDWDEAERYLSGFTKIDDDRYSTKIYFEMRKQKYLEALDNKNHAKAVDILKKDLKEFELGNEELFKEITQLLSLNDIRDHISLSSYGNTRSAREILMCALRKIIVASPNFRGKLKFPSINSQRLRHLLNQSLNWQHALCDYPQPTPHIESLFVDHVCPLKQNRCDSGPSAEPHSTGATCLGVSSDPDIECHKGFDNDSVRRANQTPDEVAVSYPDQNHSSVFIVDDDLPKTVARTLNETSSPTSMDFHPFQQTVLLVGSSLGDVGLWEVKSGVKLLSRNFKVWDIGACSVVLKAAFVKDPCVSANRVMWSPNGSLFGVAYSKHIVQLYTYHGGSDVQQCLEIDAHVGGVNDLGFSISAEQVWVITCGDDKKVKVWDATTGTKMYSFDGHDAPVQSICPHTKECTHFIFSTSVDGKIRVWLYDNLGSRIDNDTPGHGCTTMFYSTDGKRLFSCGTNKDGESFLVEWNESEGSIKSTYKGLQAHSLATVQCDRSKNQILVVGHDHSIKLWHMDNVELLTTINVDGDLPATPRLRFNKEGTLLAVSANENRIKILATSDGLQLLQTVEHRYANASRVLCETSRKLENNNNITTAVAEVGNGAAPMNGQTRNLADVTDKPNEEDNNKSKDRSLYKISRSPKFRYSRLPAQVKTNEISRLIYTNSGDAVLALGSNGIHLLWKWSRSDLNLHGKATTEVLPQLRHPRNGLEPMINDLIVTNPNKAIIPCLALSKNDSYLISASGGMISLFNIMSFKKIMVIKSPPKAATCLAFHPRDNNIVAIGMDNSTILIYNVRLDKIKNILKGHSNVVTALSFSYELNVLISSGADAQIIVWDMNGWKKLNSRFLVIPAREAPLEPLRTHVQFHQDQTQFLFVHETRLAIYEARELPCLKLRVIKEVPVPLHHATFSCDCQMVYAGFVDGTVCIYDGLELVPMCKINPTSYLTRDISDNVCSVVIAAHPQIPTQFAVGLSNGGVYVMEPQKDVGHWPNSISDKTPPETFIGDNFELMN